MSEEEFNDDDDAADIIVNELEVLAPYFRGQKESVKLVLRDMVLKQLHARSTGNTLVAESLGREMYLLAAEQKVMVVNVGWEMVFRIAERFILLLFTKI